ncbi:MAG: electron transfer flavoprotein subunit alpha/FixB family protein [Anaerolineales bacterium]
MSAKRVFVYVDHFKGKALPTSWEIVGAGRSLADQLGGSVTAIVVGHQIETLAKQAIQYGADAAMLADDAVFADYRAEPYTTAVSKAAANADLLLFPTTTRGREIAGLSAIDLNSGVITDVTALELQNGKIVATKPVYAGKLLAKVTCDANVQIATLRARAFPTPEANASRTGTITQLDAGVTEANTATKIVGYTQTEGGVSLTDANIIVSGGRGVSNNPKLTPPSGMDDKQAEIWRAQEGFKLVGDLASVLGAAVGASRAAVDAGYIPYANQVGQTGKVVSPNLYIACGISGAIQHQAGMRSAKVIVAINKDAEAPIFKLARYGVVGDLFEILPALTKAFKAKLGK